MLYMPPHQASILHEDGRDETRERVKGKGKEDTILLLYMTQVK